MDVAQSRTIPVFVNAARWVFYHASVPLKSASGKYRILLKCGAYINGSELSKNRPSPSISSPLHRKNIAILYDAVCTFRDIRKSSASLLRYPLHLYFATISNRVLWLTHLAAEPIESYIVPLSLIIYVKYYRFSSICRYVSGAALVCYVTTPVLDKKRNHFDE